MKAKLVNNSPKIFVLVFDSGDEVVAGISLFARNEGIYSASLSAIGAFSKATIGYFDFALKDYRKIEINEQVELLTLTGDLAEFQNEPKLHAHIVLGKSDGSAYGGHLLKAYVKPTLEVVLTELPAYLHRKMDKDSGIPLIRL